jgi:hypothetical protein
MTDSAANISSSFDEIKQGLDPSFNYLVCEKDIRSKDDAEFEEVRLTLSQLKIETQDHKIHCDENVGKCIFVAKLGSTRIDTVLKRLLDSNLPKNLVFSIYSSRSF